MFTKLLTAASLALVASLGAPTQAQAAPVFLLPDINFVTHGDGLFLHGDTARVSVNEAAGDIMSIDQGSGFTHNPDVIATLTIDVNGKTGTLASNSGSELGAFKADLVSWRVTHTEIGHDVFGVFRVTESTQNGFTVGSLVGFDALAFNCHRTRGTEACQIKGDVAPLVPEPATLGLLVLGLGGLAAGSRRKRG